MKLDIGMTSGTLISRVTSASYTFRRQDAALGIDPVNRQIYFEISFFSSEGEKVIAFNPGEKYYIRINVSHNTYSKGLTQYPCTPSKDLAIHLTISDYPQSHVQILQTQYICPRSELANCSFQQEFELFLNSESPYGLMNLELSYKENFNDTNHLACTRQVEIQGHAVLDEYVAKECSIDPSYKPPNSFALLHVIPAGESFFRLLKWNSGRKIESKKIPFEQIGLASFVEDRVDPEYILQSADAFSRLNPGGVISWINQLFQKYNKDLHLVIVDHTNFEIPWEMLELEHGTYLGALVKVSRWSTIHNYSEEKHLRFDAERSEGSIISYVASDLGDEAIRMERKTLSNFHSIDTDNLQHFQKIISEPFENIGVAYLACHGIFSYRKEHRRVIAERIDSGLLSIPGGVQIRSIDLENIPNVISGRPIFIVNACHSARIFCVGGEDEEKRFYGLPSVLLARIARAYIGTTGPVGTKYAAKIIEFIFEQIKDNIQLAEVLQKLRESAVSRLQNGSALSRKDDLLFLIYSFMYIYYGNPMLQVKITGKPEIVDND